MASPLLLPGCSGDGGAPPSPQASLDDPDGQGRAEGSQGILDQIDADGPGCSAAVGIDGEVVWAGAAGLADLDAREPITPDTVFDIASTSKQFTATAVLLLEAEGALDLDAPLSSTLPGLPGWADRVTVRHLVHHQSGIPEYFLGLEEDFDEPTTVEDALEAIGEIDELDFEPGTRFEYSNSGYFLLSQVVEAETGLPLAEFLDREVFEPLGLDAVLDPTPDIPERALGYALEDDTYVPTPSAWEQTGDGGIQTTPSELVRWAAEYWEPTIGGADLLEARTAGAVSDGEGGLYGAGIVVTEVEDGEMVVSHARSWAGFETDLIVVPGTRGAAAVSCNADDLDPSELAESLLELWGLEA